MKIFAFLNKEEVRKEDVLRLEAVNASLFYKQNLADTSLLFDKGEEKILLLQWTGLKPEGKAAVEDVLKIPDLKAVCLSTTAYTWLDGQLLRNAGIDLCNCPGKSTDSVAEYFYFMTIGLLRNLGTYLRDGWKESDNPKGREVTGLTAGIVGLGAIGKRYAEVCSQNGMKVVYWNRSPKSDVDGEAVDLSKLFSRSDVIFIALAGNDGTFGIIKKEHIDMMKKDAVILNCAQEGLIDKNYVIEKVGKREIGGFGFESFEEMNEKFQGNVLVMPEVAYYTKNTLENESRVMSDTALAYLRGEPVNIVN